MAGFPISFTLNKLQDALDKVSTQKCNNCGKLGTTKLCSECESLLYLQCSPSHHHSTSETSTDNPTAELGGAFGGLESIILESIFCEKHPKNQMSLYCEDCTEAICTACMVNHKRHAILDQQEMANLEKTSIKESVAKMMSKLLLCQDQGELMEEKERVGRNVDEVISQVKRRFDNSCKQVHSAEKEIITQLTEEQAKIETRIDIMMEENVVLSHKPESCIEKQQGLRKTADDMKIIQGKQKLGQEVEELTKAKINRIEEHIQWRLVPGTMDPKSMKDLVGTLQKSYIKSSSGVESNNEHISTDSAASARSCPQKPVLTHSIPQYERSKIYYGVPEAVCDIVICEDGEVYAATRRGVKIYSAAGVYIHTIADDADAQGIAELPGGKLAISCGSDKTVKVFSKDGSYVHTVAAGHRKPYSLALLHNGALAVRCKGCVKVFKDCGERADVVSVIWRVTLGSIKQQPTTRRKKMKTFTSRCHLTAHGENGLIVSDYAPHAVYAFTAGEQGEYTCQWIYGGSQRGRGPGMLDRPRGVATDSQGRVLIADCGNDRVLLLSPDGEMLMELLTWENAVGYPSLVAVGAGTLAVIKSIPLFEEGWEEICLYSIEK